MLPRDPRARRERLVVLVVALLLLGAAHPVDPIWPLATPALVAAGVGLAAAGGGLPGLVVAVFGAGLAPLPTALRVAFGIAALASWERASRIDEAAEELTNQAFVDQLTGLATRPSFVEALGQELARVRRYGGRCALIVLELDRFAELQGRHGHGAGSDLLRAVGGEILRLKRDSDLAARFGGAEVVLLVPGSAAGAEQLAERIRAHVAGLGLTHGDRRVGTTVSAGIAEYPTDGESEQALFAAADAALSAARRHGPGTVLLAPSSSALERVARQRRAATG